MIKLIYAVSITGWTLECTNGERGTIVFNIAKIQDGERDVNTSYKTTKCGGCEFFLNTPNSLWPLILLMSDFFRKVKKSYNLSFLRFRYAILKKYSSNIFAITCLMLRVPLTHWKQMVFSNQAGKWESAFISTPYRAFCKIVELTGNIMKRFRDTSPLILQHN